MAAETGSTLDQIVLARQLGHEVPIIPLAGASSVERPDEILGAAELELSTEQRAKLDAAH